MSSPAVQPVENADNTQPTNSDVAPQADAQPKVAAEGSAKAQKPKPEKLKMNIKSDHIFSNNISIGIAPHVTIESVLSNIKQRYKVSAHMDFKLVLFRKASDSKTAVGGGSGTDLDPTMTAYTYSDEHDDVNTELRLTKCPVTLLTSTGVVSKVLATQDTTVGTLIKDVIKTCKLEQKQKILAYTKEKRTDAEPALYLEPDHKLFDQPWIASEQVFMKLVAQKEWERVVFQRQKERDKLERERKEKEYQEKVARGEIVEDNKGKKKADDAAQEKTGPSVLERSSNFQKIINDQEKQETKFQRWKREAKEKLSGKKKEEPKKEVKKEEPKKEEEAKPSEAKEEAKPSEAKEEAKPSEAKEEAKPSEATEEAKPSETTEEVKAEETPNEPQEVQADENNKEDAVEEKAEEGTASSDANEPLVQ